MSKKQIFFISLFVTLFVIITPIRPRSLGFVLSGVGGFFVGWSYVEYLKEKDRK